MSPGEVDRRVIAQRASWVAEMISGLKALPLKDKHEFLGSRHYIAAAESYLRRSLEALFDMGRHILVKKFAYPATEYKEIARALSDKKILTPEESELMRKMAGYRNRMVHFYHEISPEELHELCLNHLDEIDVLLRKLLEWVKANQTENP